MGGSSGAHTHWPIASLPSGRRKLVVVIWAVGWWESACVGQEGLERRVQVRVVAERAEDVHEVLPGWVALACRRVPHDDSSLPGIEAHIGRLCLFERTLRSALVTALTPSSSGYYGASSLAIHGFL